ncbi:MAG: hypothetical protein ACKO8Z_01625 [Prosthecobacter sp.]
MKLELSPQTQFTFQGLDSLIGSRRQLKVLHEHQGHDESGRRDFASHVQARVSRFINEKEHGEV